MLVVELNTGAGVFKTETKNEKVYNDECFSLAAVLLLVVVLILVLNTTMCLLLVVVVLIRSSDCFRALSCHNSLPRVANGALARQKQKLVNRKDCSTDETRSIKRAIDW